MSPPGIPASANPSPLSYRVVLTQRLAYDLASPPSRRTPCNMPSPMNQWPVSALTELDPLRTYSPASSSGIEPVTLSEVDRTSLETGAKLPCSHQGLSPFTWVSARVVLGPADVEDDNPDVVSTSPPQAANMPGRAATPSAPPPARVRNCLRFMGRCCTARR
ncbi:hypothetical protein BN381_110035 [Candidatus Microthrix parvicella RN1]|uniref:Uncharacterized protein n=1 Tax=Candidatus Neomicrothrix parvicella RN1 TaxID=1229780 RepID=R4YW82_9ACTN|nr:hypothetical protein BN381_110035 [Candidatus Microthrix parvicella RN1]